MDLRTKQPLTDANNIIVRQGDSSISRASKDTILNKINTAFDISQPLPKASEYSNGQTAYFGKILLRSDGKDWLKTDGKIFKIKTLVNTQSLLYDPRPAYKGRIWGMFIDAAYPTNNWYTDIKFSDDWGDTWTQYVALPFAKPSGSSGMFMDSAGNIYYNKSNNKLARVAASNQAVTDVIDFFPVSPATNVFNWSFTEGSDGSLYLAQYFQGLTPGHYLWVAPAGGTSGTWVRKDFLVNKYGSDRHFHSIRVNPYDDKLYITWGDDAIKSLVARSKGAGASILATDNFDSEFDILTGVLPFGGGSYNPKPTDITFTSEGIWLGDDRANQQCWVQSAGYPVSGLPIFNKVFKHPSPWELQPAYYIAAANKNEIWLSVYDESTNSDYAPLVKLTKNDGIDSRLVIAEEYVLESRNTSRYFHYSLAKDNRGLIPDWAEYVMLTCPQISADGIQCKTYLISR